MLQSPEGEHRETSLPTGLNGCNNEAELLALCMALDLARAAGACHLLLCGDSAVAIRYVAGNDETRIARLQALIARARAALAGFAEARLLWVPRHRNRDADRLARQALGLAPKPAVVPGARRRRR